MAGRSAQLRGAARFAVSLYAGRARGVVDAYGRRDDFALLRTAGLVADPYPAYDRIRAAGPFLTTAAGHLVTADHAVAEAVLRHRRLGTEPERPGPRDPHSDRSLLTLNPPDHDRLRRLVAPAFSATRLSVLRSTVSGTVDRLLDDAARQPTFDLVEALARPLPIAVVTDLLGIDARTGTALAAYGATLGEAAAGLRSLRQARRVGAAAHALTRGFEGVIASRRRDPGDDLVSALLAAEGDGAAQVRAAELVPLCRMLLIAGFETTVNLLGSAVLLLLDRPERWAALVADPGLAGAVVQETLRFESPVQRTGRVALEDVEIAGWEIPAGRWVNVLLGAANRDAAVFAEPHRFDPDRRDGHRHLAFSSGIHRCLGRPLAELEATLALQRLAERMPRLRRVGAVRRARTSLTRGPSTLPVAAS